VRTGAKDPAAQKNATYRFIVEEAKTRGLTEVPADAKLEHQRMMGLKRRVPGFRIVDLDEAVAPAPKGQPAPCEAPVAPGRGGFTRSPGAVAKGGPLVIVAATAGKFVEHETGSPVAGGATTLTLALAPGLIKHGGRPTRASGSSSEPTPWTRDGFR